MGINIDSSAIGASTAKLSVLGANIANVNTVGYKSSSFDDILGQSFGSSIVKDFSQGAITVDHKPLDVAINGNGFFKLQPGDPITNLPSTNQNASPLYTRDGRFMINSNGYLTDNGGNFLIGSDGNPIKIPEKTPAVASTNGSMQLNLDSAESIPSAAFNALDSTTYNKTTATTIYDAQGNKSTLNTYFVKTAANTWDVYSSNSSNLDTAPTKDATLTFNANGQLLKATGTGVPAAGITTDAEGNPSINLKFSGASGVSFTLDNPTQFASYYSNQTKTDGTASGAMTTCNISSDGSVIPTYDSNGSGVSRAISQKIALYIFPNNNGLKTAGINNWNETLASGSPTQNIPGTSGVGSLQSGATEGSNVDTTTAMVDLLSAQRTFQAESQVINTQSQVLQTLTQLGR